LTAVKKNADGKESEQPTNRQAVTSTVKKFVSDVSRNGIRDTVKKYIKYASDRFIDFAVDRVSDSLCESLFKVESLAVLSYLHVQSTQLGSQISTMEALSDADACRFMSGVIKLGLVRSDVTKFPWSPSVPAMRCIPAGWQLYTVATDTNNLVFLDVDEMPVFVALSSVDDELLSKAQLYKPKPALTAYGSLYDGSDPAVVLKALDVNVDNYDMASVLGTAQLTGPAFSSVAFSATELFLRLILYSASMVPGFEGFLQTWSRIITLNPQGH
jgi:hypothetical protein